MGANTLRLDWATQDAARFACEHWHYSKCLPGCDLVKIGVWENSQFVGVIIFSRGATPQIGSPYGLKNTEICELTRIALRSHNVPVSRILAIALKLFRKHCPGIRLIVSFADTSQGHHGGIYQASGWMYAGYSKDTELFLLGRIKHRKSVYSRYGCQSVPWLRKNVDANAKAIKTAAKHRYLMPLDSAMRAQIAPLAQPYPKRVKQATDGYHSSSGGAAPTDALQFDDVRSERHG